MPPLEPPPTVPQRRDLIAGLEKGLAVICAFDQERPLLSVTEVAQRCGLTRAAARRYLITLEHLGFMRSERGRWSLSAKVLRLAQSYMHSGRLPRLVQPELHRVVAALKEASSAGVLEGDDVICIAALSAGHLVSSTLQPGTRVPAYCTANGRVLLAALPDEDLEAWLADRRFAPLTPNTLTDPARLRAEIARVRRQGYAVVDQELELGLRTLSVPLQGSDGTVLAAINVSVQAARRSVESLLDDCLPALRQTQANLRRQL
ncbi:MAG: helix-turn-helix domain-containing protein [Piscinibacter sp.]|nr:helix-turn-helix domain-containing protein [Piscinibacter sp.]